ncbi:MAG: hypothetical protein AAGB22_04685, partial [Bacteroidota bacterium]
MNVVTALLIYLAAAFAIAFILNRILLKFASNLGTRHGEQLVRWSSSSKPSVGGISFYITFLVTILLFFIL